MTPAGTGSGIDNSARRAAFGGAVGKFLPESLVFDAPDFGVLLTSICEAMLLVTSSGLGLAFIAAGAICEAHIAAKLPGLRAPEFALPSAEKEFGGAELLGIAFSRAEIM